VAQRTLEVVITGNNSQIRGVVADTEGRMGGFASKMASIGKRISSAGRALTIGVTLPVLAFGAIAYGELKESEKVAAQTNAAIKSTGGVAHVSAADVDRLSSSLLRKSGVDDELIHSGANLLLTFKNVRNELGEGNRIFDRATKAALDLSVSGFGDMSATSKMLGKALNDPIKGMTALGRAGVTFSDAQKDAIKTMVEHGDLLGAQKLILGEVESQVGGAAAAYGKTMPGQIARGTEELKNSGAEILKTVLPALVELAKGVLSVAKFFGDLPKPVQMGVLAFVGFVAIVGPVLVGIGAIISALSVLAAHPVVLLIMAIVASIAILIATALFFYFKWNEIWAWIQNNPAIAAVILLVTSVMAPFLLVAAALGVFAANWEVIWAWIQQAATDAWRWIQQAFNDALAWIQAAPGQIWGFLSGLPGMLLGLGLGMVQAWWNGMLSVWGQVIGWFTGLPGAILGALGDLGGLLLDAGRRLIDGLVNGITSAPGRIVNAIKGLIPGSGLLGAAKGVIEDVFGLASGGPFPAGWTGWVGENGPELVTFGQAGRVFSNPESMAMVSAARSAPSPSSAPVQNFNFYGQIDPRTAADEVSWALRTVSN